MEEVEVEVAFASFDPLSKGYKKISIKKKDLERFSTSLLSMIFTSRGAFKKDYKDDLKAFVIDIEPNMLHHVEYFYKNKKWKNPYLRENNLEFDQLEKITDYLNLPDDIEDPEDPVEEHDEDEYPDFDSESSEEWDPNLRDDRFDADDYYIDYGYDPNPYGHT